MHRILPAAEVDFYKATGIASNAAGTVMAIIAERIAKRPTLNAAAPAHAKPIKGLGEIVDLVIPTDYYHPGISNACNTGACV